MAASAPTVPTGGTYFDTLKRSFTDVPLDKSNDNAISTSEFLEACESLTTLFDVLGSVAFKPVKNDMIGNIKVRCHNHRNRRAEGFFVEAQRKISKSISVATSGLLLPNTTC
jgi:hypothetical protein